jgi:hypothetical protein
MLRIAHLGPFFNLQAGTLYYWRVRLKCPAGYSPYSAVATFRTGSGGTLPPATTLASPANSSTGLGPSATLVWQAQPGAIVYQVWYHQLGTTSYSFRTPTEPTRTVTALNPNAIYEWYVVVRNHYGYGAESLH